MEFFVTIVKGCQQLSIVTISSMLHVAGVPFPPLAMVLKCTEINKKIILSDIETILSECLGGNKCQHLISFCKTKFMIGFLIESG